MDRLSHPFPGARSSAHRTTRLHRPLGREQSGRPGDYLVESSEGMRRITTQAIFEDIYVALAQNNGASGVLARPVSRASPEDRARATA